MKNKRWLRGSLAVVLSTWIGWASADPVTLQGEVLQKGSGDPILGASVYVVDNDSINATSDEHGRFTLTLPAPGDYTLGAVAVGFESTKQIPITADAARGPIKIYLSQDFTLPPVVVRAERSAERVSKTVITGEELSQVPGAAGDPLRAIQTLPGIADAHGAPAIRGSGPEDNAYYVDGVPVGYLFHIGGITSVLPTNMVDDFNLYAAAFGPEYGDVTGAVIDVALRKPRTDRLGGKINVSLISADALIEGPISANQSVMLSARRSYFDYLIRNVDNGESGDKVSFPSYYDYQGKYVWEVNDANTFIVNMNGASDRLKFSTSEKSEAAKEEPTLVGASAIAESYHTQNIEWNRRVSATAVNKLYAGHMRTASSALIGTSIDADVAFNNLFLRDEFRFEPAANHTVTLGGNYSNLDWHLDAELLHSACSPDLQVYCDPSTRERKQIKNDYLVRSVSLFAKDRWRVTPDLTLIGGVHWTRDDYLDRAYVEPRLGLEWDWTPRTLIVAGWGKYNQFPGGAIEKIGNPNLQRFRATHNVLGVAQKLDAGWSWKLEGYYKTLDDLVVNDLQLNYINGGSGTAHGVELLVKKDRSTPWSGWLSLTYSQSRRRIDATGESYPVYFDQPVITNGVLNYKHSANWSYGARWSYNTGNPYTPILRGEQRTGSDPATYVPVLGEPNSRRFPAFHRLDLRVDRHIVYDTWKLNAYLEILNAYYNKSITGYEYNADYSEKTPSYQLPILPYIGIEMAF